MLTLDETGRLVGGFAWVELRLFEVVGGWVPEVAEPEVVAHLAAASRRHAGRAELWLGHRPVVAGRDPDDLVAAPSPAAEAAVTGLAGAADAADPAGATADRLARLYRGVMPALLSAYAAVEQAASPIADPALRRSLRVATAEAAGDVETGERLLDAVRVAHGGPAQGEADLALTAANFVA